MGLDQGLGRSLEVKASHHLNWTKCYFPVTGIQTKTGFLASHSLCSSAVAHLVRASLVWLGLGWREPSNPNKTQKNQSQSLTMRKKQLGVGESTVFKIFIQHRSYRLWHLLFPVQIHALNATHTKLCTHANISKQCVASNPRSCRLVKHTSDFCIKGMESFIYLVRTTGASKFASAFREETLSRNVCLATKDTRSV